MCLRLQDREQVPGYQSGALNMKTTPHLCTISSQNRNILLTHNTSSQSPRVKSHRMQNASEQSKQQRGRHQKSLTQSGLEKSYQWCGFQRKMGRGRKRHIYFFTWTRKHDVHETI